MQSVSDAELIPRIFHRVVPEVVPPRFEEFWQRLQALHPAWEFRTWADPLDPSEFETGPLFAECTSGAQLAGLVRLEVVHRHGGIYVDMDVEPLRSFEELRELPCFIGTEDGRILTDAVFGAVPGHPGIRAALDRAKSTPMTAGAWATGPGVVTHVLSQRDDVEVLPPEVFYPYLWQEPWREREDFTATTAIAVHHWNMSWKESPTSRFSTQAVRVREGARRKLKLATEQAKTLLERQEPRSRVLHGGYIGHGRVLIDSALDLPVLASASDLSLTPELLRTGDYDGRFREFVLRYVRPGARVVDVGANIGYFTLAMAKACGVHGHVHSFEPDPTVLPLLRDNVRLNHFDHRITVHPVAAGAQAGVVPFTQNLSFLGNSFVGDSDELAARPASDEVEVIEVEAVRLDTVLAGVRRIALVKVDVEGREVDVLDGLAGLLERNAVGALDLEILEHAIGHRWDAFAATFSAVVDKHRASLSALNRHGDLLAMTLDDVLAERHFSHLVVEFPT